jgi:putative membrane protein
MPRLLLRWLVGVIAILITGILAHALDLRLDWEPAWRVIIFVPVLAVINVIIGPVLRLMSLPINCLTFGLFSFLVNALLFWIAGRATGAQMDVWGALFGSVVYALLSTVLSWPIKEKKD